MIWNIAIICSNLILLHRTCDKVAYSLKYEIKLSAFDATSKHMMIRSSSFISSMEKYVKRHITYCCFISVLLKRYTFTNPGHGTNML